MTCLTSIQLCYLIRYYYEVFTPLPQHTHTHSSNKNYISAARSSSTDPGEVSDKGLPTNRQIHSSSTDSDNE